MDYVFAILGAASVFILVISKKCSTFAADFKIVSAYEEEKKQMLGFMVANPIVHMYCM